jgi:predicted secreted protein
VLKYKTASSREMIKTKLKIQTDLQYRLETTAGFVWQMYDFKMYETDPQI